MRRELAAASRRCPSKRVRRRRRYIEGVWRVRQRPRPFFSWVALWAARASCVTRLPFVRVGSGGATVARATPSGSSAERDHEGTTVGQADVREVQDHPPPRSGAGDLPEPATQAASGVRSSMARIAGVNIPLNKRVEIGLTYIYGIGRPTSNEILAEPRHRARTRYVARPHRRRGHQAARPHRPRPRRRGRPAPRAQPRTSSA